MNRKRKSGIILVSVLLLLWITQTYGLPFLAEKKIRNILAGYGLENAVITSLDSKRGELMFSNVKLDKEGFSFIESIRARAYWSRLFSDKIFFSQIVIDNLVLAGELRNKRNLDIAGWKPIAAVPFTSVESVILNGGQLDLLTAAGAIRFEAKGRMSMQSDGGHKIEAALWGTQHQITFDSRWNIDLNPAGAWTAVADIHEARINTASLSISRAQSWLNLRHDGLAQQTFLSGQLSAGQLRLGETATLHNATVTVDGPWNKYQAILQAEAAAHENVTLTADLSYNYDKLEQVHVIIVSPDDKKLFSFLEELKNGVQTASAYGDSLTSLLITPGNIERIGKDLEKIKYDRLELVIDGAPYDLTGKIIARQFANGSQKNYVISMNPGDL